ncbi:efflux RND transporter permease subunit [Shewanella fidelis]|uniref:Efflux RND transporter permease subunit n=1 Tax=Shewanella fidelis TaxID=173509 RepID=A0AAW8NHP1_9GAMM|nr:efflux RND transporter permease subunit [Shewanella fidelis]MDR8522220.1 efflux RND transporter permease subunit [Shewanella fidelis]MDW4812564.1 efflux RND transporter permease subunit [Shewanella fidelis]MDW4816312.1 efflux RND transporter permease subunit [Shewanella fidelis]MDW4820805.1 efflux RND transporter permease subunit [Shewanella fidelis]MDW4825028.1 efflux RND transporter permease subunit [Shewanella fidelis]
MNFAEYSITHKVISWMFALLLLVGGTISFFSLGQLEFPEFTIKQALVVTAYPGASPEQVEEEVTLPLEDALQQLDGIKHITSVNSAGLSQIEIEIKDNYGADELPQVWDEVRRKINDKAVELPPGVMAPKVIDDFGDVYGILLNVSGEGYSDRELQNYADFLRRELVLVKGIKKVTIAGIVNEQVVVEISQQKLNALGLDQNYIYGLINSQNVVSNAGSMLVGDNRIRIHPTGEFNKVSQMERLVISPPGSAKLIYLGDIAKIYKDTEESPESIYHADGKKALSIGIAFSSGVNVVNVGEAVNARMAELNSELPIGMSLDTVYDQSKMVDQTVNGFLVNLAESIAIVIGVLLIFMGVRSGLLMGLVLLLTILGTFVVMNVLNIELQIISLGALIIALGMLVDNAIVVTEGILIGIKRGQTRLETAKQVISQTQWPLLGATIIAIIAFAPIGLSDNSTGEFCASLFQVLLISLFISWITAMTLTPFFCNLMFKDGIVSEEENDDPYKGWLFGLYRYSLNLAMRFRVVTLLLVISALISSVFGFAHVKNVFFPASNTPMFFVDVWMPEGSDIKATERLLSRIETDLMAQQQAEDIGLVNLTTVVGQGAQRFVLSYVPEKGYKAYGQLLLEMTDLQTLNSYMRVLERELSLKYPEAQYRFKYMENGPSPAAKIEARFYGEDPQVLRQLAAQAETILKAEPTAVGVRHNWRNQVTIVRPQLALAQARETGISKQDLDSALLTNFSGQQVGTYRENSHLLPIIARAPAEERLDAQSIWKLQIWSSENNTFVPVTQVVSDFTTEWEDPLIMRRDRKRVISVLADPINGTDETADSVFRKVKTDIEAIPLPAGYELEWGGEYETSLEAQESVFSSIPLGYLAMFLITVLLFNSVRQPLVIWFTVPLSLIGVVSGLLLFDAPFSFMALLGLLSLTGMIIKNGIVLVDQINLELSQGKPAYQAVVDSAVSRVRPVLMAAITTMLGMIPLLSDAFFGSMAITIIFGLGFASVLTLIVLPVTYTLAFRIPYPRKQTA